MIGLYGLEKKLLTQKVSVTCYGKTNVLSRESALRKYREAIACSDGSERERYEKIFFELLDGEMSVSDV